MNEVIFVPDNDVVTFICPVEGDDELTVRMEFPDESFDESLPEDKRPQPRFDVQYENPPESIHIDCLVLKFFNFGKGFGQSLTAPYPIAVADNKEIVSFLASVQKLGGMRKVEFQFMLGGDFA
ncbi:hypothetical protein [Pseudomonas zeae]|uniref:Uncharacterized protein n=1 Tax=Pseudomonas zeae TaxID=2745510 RepID=A0ABU5BL62_9PSED|nr:hypothetical protein [Pseudomonas zeae]MDX9677392.1 hypothetical protein [Pseudomonas zeae]